MFQFLKDGQPRNSQPTSNWLKWLQKNALPSSGHSSAAIEVTWGDLKKKQFSGIAIDKNFTLHFGFLPAIISHKRNNGQNQRTY